MVAGTLAQELVEEFAGFETSDDKLAYAEEFAAMAGKTWYFGPPFVIEASIVEMQGEGYFRAGRAMPPSAGETVPNPLEGYAVVFKDFFMCGLRLHSIGFLCQVLETF
jgi:hypothetical protein